MINKFPDYEYIPFGEDKKPHNMYHGIDLGFGGLVLANPGMYGRSITLDVSGMHPASIRALNAFGDYTEQFGEIVDLRLAIKHKDFDTAKKMMDGKAAKYLDDPDSAKALAQALKIAVNSVYGLTSATFDNVMRDSRNVNNIVALRGALFMAMLKELVEEKGYTVIHIKTDSIKIENPDDDIIKFVNDMGLKYGYTFEIEHIFEKICLVNNAVYIAKLAEDDPEWMEACEKAKKEGKPLPTRWTATGKQFQVPYVFKTLFSHEKIEFDDMCETMSVATSLYLDVTTEYEKIEELEKSIKSLEKLNKLHPSKSTEEEIERIKAQLVDIHNYRFIGKVGEFCPMLPNTSGGILYREKDGKYYAATGTKGYFWQESEIVRELNKAADIDHSYYRKLVDEAVETISQYGDFEMFAS